MAAIQATRSTPAGQAGIWSVVLANPGKRNAMNQAMWHSLRQVFVDIQADTQARCVVVQGEGAAFCAGGDIAEYPSFRFDPVRLQAFHEETVWGALSAMLACDVPVLACIEGPCMGGGLEIASCCDMRWASAQATFGAPIAKLGLPMAPRELQLVAQAVGSHVARRMLLEAAVFSAQEMAALGFVAPPLDSAQLHAEVWVRAQRVAALAPQAARLNKQALRHLAQGSVPPQPYAYAPSAEHQEGVQAFLDKRAPQFGWPSSR